jgi:hypothetical protein
LCGTIELNVVPLFTTFQKAAQRLLAAPSARLMLDKTIHLAQMTRRLKARVPLAAGDGSGWESHHMSHYYVKRRASCSKYRQKTT